MCGFGSVICRTADREAAGGVCAPAQRADEPSSKSALGRVASRRKHVSSYAVVVPVFLGLVLLTILTAAALKGHRLASKRSGGTELVNASGLSRDIDLVRWRSEPLRIELNVLKVSLDRDWESIDMLAKRVSHPRTASSANVMHAFRTFEPGCEPRRSELRTLSQLQFVLMDRPINAAWCGPQDSLVLTPEGLRCVTSGMRNRPTLLHRDQAVALLRERGGTLGVLPVSTEWGGRPGKHDGAPLRTALPAAGAVTTGPFDFKRAASFLFDALETPSDEEVRRSFCGHNPGCCWRFESPRHGERFSPALPVNVAVTGESAPWFTVFSATRIRGVRS